MNLFRRPGLSLLLIGLILFFGIRPIVGSIWVIGGLFGGIAFVTGLLGIVGGGYLFARSIGAAR